MDVTDSARETDQALVQAIREGSASAFETLYHRYRSWVVSLAYRFCGNHEDALDVLQETFSYLFRRAPTLELRSRMQTFLYPAVKHIALSRKKLAKRHMTLDQDVEESPSAEPPGDIRRMMESLPATQQEVVWLRFVDGLDLREIAEAMEVPIGTVKSRLHAAIQTLKRRTK